MEIGLANLGRGPTFNHRNKRLCPAHFADECFESCLKAELVADDVAAADGGAEATPQPAESDAMVFLLSIGFLG